MAEKFLVVASGNGKFQTEIVEFNPKKDKGWEEEFDTYEEYQNWTLQDTVDGYEQGLMSAVVIAEKNISELKNTLNKM